MPAATTGKAVDRPVAAFGVAGCVVREGTAAVTTTAVFNVAGELGESLTT